MEKKTFTMLETQKSYNACLFSIYLLSYML